MQMYAGPSSVARLQHPQSNVAFVVTSDSRSHKDASGGTSTSNEGHQQIVLEIAHDLLEKVDASKDLTAEEKANFTIRALTPYVAQKDGTVALFKDLNDPRLVPSTGHSCQSVQNSFVILDTPNSKILSCQIRACFLLHFRAKSTV
jgi:hypothetical protein